MIRFGFIMRRRWRMVQHYKCMHPRLCSGSFSCLITKCSFIAICVVYRVRRRSDIAVAILLAFIFAFCAGVHILSFLCQHALNVDGIGNRTATA